MTLRQNLPPHKLLPTLCECDYIFPVIYSLTPVGRGLTTGTCHETALSKTKYKKIRLTYI